MKNTTIFGILMVLSILLVFSLSVAENENATAATNNTTNVTMNNTTNMAMNATNMINETNATNMTNPFAKAKGISISVSQSDGIQGKGENLPQPGPTDHLD
jgi:hypothetical protein